MVAKASVENESSSKGSEGGGPYPPRLSLSNTPRVHPKETSRSAFGSNDGVVGQATGAGAGVGGGGTEPIVPRDFNGKPILKWKRGEQIGSGNYGRVYVCLNEETGSLMAVKELKVIRRYYYYF